jgi:hypothetical protein
LSQFLQNALSVTAIDAKANSSASKTAVWTFRGMISLHAVAVRSWRCPTPCSLAFRWQVWGQVIVLVLRSSVERTVCLVVLWLNNCFAYSFRFLGHSVLVISYCFQWACFVARNLRSRIHCGYKIWVYSKVTIHPQFSGTIPEIGPTAWADSVADFFFK